MAAQAGINETTANDLVPASGIVQFIIPPPLATPIYEALAMQIDCSRLGSNVADIPGWDTLPATETTAETDEVASVNYSTSKKSATGIMVSTRSLISDQVMQDSGLMTSDQADLMAINVRNTIDVTCLALFTTASNQSDNTGVNLTVALWQAALAAFRAQKIQGQAAFVGSHNQIRDLLSSLSTTVGGQQLGDAASAIFNSSAVDGYRGPYQGVHIFETGNITQADALNDHGGFVCLVPGGNGPLMSGLALPVWRGIAVRGRDIPERHGYDATASARVGFSRSTERFVRGFISKKAA